MNPTYPDWLDAFDAGDLRTLIGELLPLIEERKPIEIGEVLYEWEETARVVQSKVLDGMG